MMISDETTAKNGEKPQTRRTTQEFSYETPEHEAIDYDSEDDKSFRRKSTKSINSRSSTTDSLYTR